MTTILNDKITRWYALGDALDMVRKELNELEMEIVQEMQAAGATEQLHPDFRVTLPTRREYDPAKVVTLGEAIPKDVFDQLYSPEHDETVTVKAKVDGKIALKLLRTEYAELLENCLLPSRPRLKVEPKKQIVAQKARRDADAVFKDTRRTIQQARKVMKGAE